MMAEKDKIEKRADKNSKANVLQKIGAAFIKIGKRLKGFFINLKAELKRVIWPDRKRLIQNTATVLAICIIAGLILFIVDSLLGGILEGVGFYTPSTTTQTTVATTETVSSETTTSSSTAVTSDTTASGGTTASGETTATTAG